MTPPSDYQKKDAAHSIDSLLEKMRENEARLANEEELLAQIDALLSRALTRPVTETGRPEEEDDVELNVPATQGLKSELTVGSNSNDVGVGSGAATYGDYLKAQQKSLKAQQKSKVNFSIRSLRSPKEMRVIQSICIGEGVEWKELGEDDNNNRIDEDHGHGSNKTPWYLPPVQRHRWDEQQDLPHINWHNLFFDLFYVGAAFNL